MKLAKINESDSDMMANIEAAYGTYRRELLRSGWVEDPETERVIKMAS
jgi:hypothetical protein